MKYILSYQNIKKWRFSFGFKFPINLIHLKIFFSAELFMIFFISKNSIKIRAILENKNIFIDVFLFFFV